MIIFCDMIDSEQGKSKFNRIYEQYSKMMFSVAFDIIKQYQDAEDIVEESLVKVIGILEAIDEESIGTQKCKNLMITIAKNTAIDHWRVMKKMPIPMEYIEKEEKCKTAEEFYFETESYRELIQCIDELDNKYLDVLNLKFLHRLSSKQIAGILNISDMNVNVRIMRAKQILMKKLKERGKNE